MISISIAMTVLLSLSTLVKIPYAAGTCHCMPRYCNAIDALASFQAEIKSRPSSCVSNYAIYLEQSLFCLVTLNCRDYAFALAKATVTLLLHISLDGYGVILVHSLLNMA